MSTERLPICFQLLQKLRARLESRLTWLSPNIYYRSLRCGTSDLVQCFACFGVIFKLFSPSLCFYDIGSDGMLTLWESAARSVYNMFSVLCQEKIIESEQGRPS